MIRTATIDTLAALVQAAASSDRELDRALSDAGVLPPMELGEIRRVLTAHEAELTAHLNGDGHCVIRVATAGIDAYIHPDGRVETMTASPAA